MERFSVSDKVFSLPFTFTVICFAAILQQPSVVSEQIEGLTIPVGVILSPGNEEMDSAFRYAQLAYNNIHTNPFDLASYIDPIDVSDSFTLIKKMCERMSYGVFLFFAVKDTMTQDLIKSFTNTFHMPYITPSTAVKGEGREPSGYELHMKPDFSNSIADMISKFYWDHVHYVYDTDEGLHNVQRLLSRLSEKHDKEILPFRVDVHARRIYDIEHAHDELKQLDRMDNTAYKVIIFDLSSEDAYKQILRQIPEVGMNKEGYHYLIATLDFANMNMGRYLHGGVNITGFQLLDLDSKSLKSFLRKWRQLDRLTYPGAGTNRISYEAALVVDTVEVITRALKSMVKKSPKIFQSTFRRKQVYNYNRTLGIPCTTQPPIPWMHGDSIIEEIKKLDFQGLTGRIKFDEDGFRIGYKLDVYTVGLDLGPTKIGNWTVEQGFKTPEDESEEIMPEFEEERRYIITTILVAPFLMLKAPDPKTPIEPVGNDKFEGYVADIAEKLAKLMNFKYDLVLVKDGQYGSKDENNQTWNGMVGELTTGRADMCIAPLTITYQREEDIDFTKPFMNFGVSIMIKKPEIMKPGVFSFMEPLNAKIWVFIVFAYCAVSIGLFLVSRFSPYEWQNASGTPMENNFHLLNALWFAMGALMLQGSDSCPRSFSGRVIGTVWWFFVLIIISSYTANLAAFLTIERMHTPIESADDLAEQTDIRYGTVAAGTTKEFFQGSKVPTYRQMWTFMESAIPSVFVDTVSEGVEKVRKSKGKYAFLMESPSNEYQNNREPCDTMKVGGLLNSKGFGIATPQGSKLRHSINLAVLGLIEDGTLHKLRTKWWHDKGQCSGSDSESSGKRELSLSNVAGIFYILIGGLVLAVILASVEFICAKSKLLAKVKGKGVYLKATETVTTLAPTPTAEKENGGFAEMSPTTYTFDRDHESLTYGSQPAKIGFEHFLPEREYTDL